MTTFDGDDDSYSEIDKGWCKIWRNDAGQIHRDGDIPAMIRTDGSVFYCKDGKRHRDGDLPAIILVSNGAVYYYKDGVRHRDGGKPAVIYADGTVEYWVNGVEQK